MQNVSLWGLICAALQFLKNYVFLIEFGEGNQKKLEGGGLNIPAARLNITSTLVSRNDEGIFFSYILHSA